MQQGDILLAALFEPELGLMCIKRSLSPNSSWEVLSELSQYMKLQSCQ